MLGVTLLAALTAGVILVTMVLPAEFGVDPTGVGKALGLTGLAGKETSALDVQTLGYRVDTVRFELAPFESVEYKYRLEEGASLVFSWQATGEVVHDLHAEPDGAEAGYAQSFARSRGVAAHGAYRASFPGIHGWFWENRGDEVVWVALNTAGFYSHAVEFRDGDSVQVTPLAVGGTRPEAVDGR